MKIYIEKKGDFYAFDVASVKDVEHIPLYDDIKKEKKTDKRDFEIGARVYFDGVGWTEVINEDIYDMCHGCVFLNNDMCTGRKCNYLGREDGASIIYRQLAEEKQEKPTVVIDDYLCPPKTDAVEHPSHYADVVPGIECIQVTQHFNFNRGNAIKYIWRAGVKNPEKEIEDLKKAIQYLGYEIERLKK